MAPTRDASHDVVQPRDSASDREVKIQVAEKSDNLSPSRTSTIGRRAGDCGRASAGGARVASDTSERGWWWWLVLSSVR
jgi:hypothetical protein